jgi:hypothetical protein
MHFIFSSLIINPVFCLQFQMLILSLLQTSSFWRNNVISVYTNLFGCISNVLFFKIPSKTQNQWRIISRICRFQVLTKLFRTRHLRLTCEGALNYLLLMLIYKIFRDILHVSVVC